MAEPVRGDQPLFAAGRLRQQRGARTASPASSGLQAQIEALARDVHALARLVGEQHASLDRIAALVERRGLEGRSTPAAPTIRPYQPLARQAERRQLGRGLSALLGAPDERQGTGP